jgi:hypothetical protein
MKNLFGSLSHLFKKQDPAEPLEDFYEYHLADGRVLELIHVKYHVWSENYLLKIINNGQEEDVKLDNLEEDGSIIQLEEPIILCSGIPDFDPKTNLLSTHSQIGTRDFFDQKFKLDIKNNHFVLMEEYFIWLDVDTGKTSISEHWVKPEDYTNAS